MLKQPLEAIRDTLQRAHPHAVEQLLEQIQSLSNDRIIHISTAPSEPAETCKLTALTLDQALFAKPRASQHTGEFNPT